MSIFKYKIEFFDYWHTGSGLSSGTNADLVVLKDTKGFPYIPGRTLKGLLRQQAELLHELDSEKYTDEFINLVFGEKAEIITDEKGNEIDGYSTKESKAFFSDACLSNYIRNKKDLKPDGLYCTIASTQIDENGVAKKHSLREIEVTVPVVLYAHIDVDSEDDSYIPLLDNCMKMIKRIGMNRNRGMGRCLFSKQ